METGEVTFGLLIAAPTKDAINGEFVKLLREQGYHVEPPGPRWETKQVFMKRIGLRNHDSIDGSIAAWEGRGNTLPIRRTPTGRIIELRSNREFDLFCQRNKRPWKRS
jgi:hypothetical protein